MVSEKVLIDNELGICLDTASELVSKAKKCGSHVTLVHDEHRMNCKSLMGLIAFPVAPGTEVVIECDGEQEEADLRSIVEFLKTKI